MRKITVLPLLLFTILGCAVNMRNTASAEINSFEECVSAGYPIMRSMPARCAVPGGKVFIDPNTLPRAQAKICNDLCGDGTCQEIVCLGEGCPCPETPESCPKDCSAT